ncbi:MAG TPA: ABC transporter permease [Candidatus Dormibacteraeota bacterium]|nr:ABC transporter permease [Candidatus Dormibacteraeota bacterium]
MNLAWRNLIQDKTRAGLSVLGVALAIMLILVLGGFVSGLNVQVTRYLDHAPGSIVLLRTGLQGASSVTPTNTLPDSALTAARSTAGVAAAVPVVSQTAVLDLGSAKQFVIVVGYDPALGGGPWLMGSGREPIADDEVVVDSVLAARRGIHLGDSLTLMGTPFRVAGSSDESTTWMTGYVFMTLAAAQKLYSAVGMLTMIFVTPAHGVAVSDLIARLDSIADVEARPKAELISDTRSFYLATMGAPLNLMAGIASLVGVTVVGLVTYTATIERRREYGMLKAVGARNRVLYAVVAQQALVAALAGSIVGVAAARGAAWTIMALRPQFLITVEPSSVLTALAAGLLMALVGALFPVRTLGRLAPAEVFRG